MPVFSILKTYNPEIKIDDNIAEFDAEIDMSLIKRSQVTSYPVETGQEVSGSIFIVPTEIRVSWAIGVRKITPLLSEDFMENMETNSLGLAGGFASNFIEGGTNNFLIGLLSSNQIFASGEEESRAFKALKIIQEAQVLGKTISFTIHNIGTLKNMVITEIVASRSGKDGGKVVFDITLSHLITKVNEVKHDQLTNNKKLGRIKGEKIG